MEQANREDIEGCASSPFLGYGNPAAPVWFLGIEEGGAEVRVSFSLPRSLRARCEFAASMDLHEVWSKRFNFPLRELVRHRKGTWWGAARFMLCMTDPQWSVAAPPPAATLEYLLHHLGRSEGASFLPDIFPLPMGRGDWPSWYAAGSPWHSKRQYQQQVGLRRAEALVGLLKREPGVRLLITQSTEWTPLLLKAWGPATVRMLHSDLGEDVEEHRLADGSRSVVLVATAFWDNRIFPPARRDQLARALRNRFS